jgi:hypothetical protein
MGRGADAFARDALAAGRGLAWVQDGLEQGIFTWRTHEPAGLGHARKPQVQSTGPFVSEMTHRLLIARPLSANSGASAARSRFLRPMTVSFGPSSGPIFATCTRYPSSVRAVHFGSVAPGSKRISSARRRTSTRAWSGTNCFLPNVYAVFVPSTGSTRHPCVSAYLDFRQIIPWLVGNSVWTLLVQGLHQSQTAGSAYWPGPMGRVSRYEH